MPPTASLALGATQLFSREPYRAEDLLGRQVVAVVNLPPRRIGPFLSEVLVTGFPDAEGRVVLAVPERPVPEGARLF